MKPQGTEQVDRVPTNLELPRTELDRWQASGECAGKVVRDVTFYGVAPYSRR